MLDADKKLVLEGGKIAYGPIVEFTDKRVRYKWSSQAVAAIDEFLDGKAPARGGRDEQPKRDLDGNYPKDAHG
jgi:hypothetical protein